jgi:excisionase family DNA binding protein
VPLGVGWVAAAKLIGVSVSTLRRMAAAGKLRVLHFGTRAIIPYADLYGLFQPPQQ